ncbi:MAG TPA: PQQ-binding-like beta-propeller repeat protein [Thermoanaerobaculia bacterium]|nr:PQQ-binding-like beta-propeller repeat protein [Thermoanaerobaculia bacterium]
MTSRPPSRTRRLLPCAGFLCSLLVSGGPLLAEEPADWPQWGGPDRDFHSTATGLAESWPEGGPKQLWSRPLGDGHSTVVAVDGRLFTMYRPRGEGLAEGEFGGEEAVIALDAATGDTLWEHRYPSAQLNFQFGAGPHSTPLVAGGRVFTVGTNKQLHAFDAATGKVLWSWDLVADLGAPPTLVRPQVKAGYGASPLAYGDTVIVTVGGDGQAVVAFRQSDGEIVWKSGDFLIAPASPVLIELDGQEQLIVVGGEQVNGLDPRTGALLWSHPQDAPGDMNNTTPVFGDDGVLFMSVAYDNGSRALRLRRTAESTAAKELWFAKSLQVMFSNTLKQGDFIVGSSGDFGPVFLVALDWKTGEMLWRERGFGRSSFLWADGKVLLLDEDGELALTRMSRAGLEILDRAEVLSGKSWTAPSLVGTTLFLRDRRVIKALDLGG